MENAGLFSIGQMAKWFHLSQSSIRYYEKSGLLTPEYVDPDTGYRYYSTRQFEVFNTIRYLRALDMPLPQIADFLQNRDVARIEEKLRQQKQEVGRRKQALERIERKIDNRLHQLSDAQALPLGQIEQLESEPCRLFWIGQPSAVAGAICAAACIHRSARLDPGGLFPRDHAGRLRSDE